MSRTIYVSFLGTGNYTPAEYVWGARKAARSPYGQEAELELLEPTPDRVLIFGTTSSREVHWEKHKYTGEPGLKPRLERLGLKPEFVEISADLSTGAQWGTFQKMLSFFGPGDGLVLDMTHGFRAVPVVLSSALHFLRLARRIEIRHVLYASHDAQPASIIDYADFYVIQDWTDGVSRLVEDADAGKLVELSRGHSQLRMEGFSGPDLTEALRALTMAVRNVEVQSVETKARHALTLVEAARKRAEDDSQIASTILLELVQEKFASLASAEPLSGRYDADYFKIQLELIDLLLEHNLFMQGFTAMRELVGSVGMLGYDPIKFGNSRGRGKRSYAEVFIAMVQYSREKWTFTDDRQRQVERLLPFYDRLVERGVVADLQTFITPMNQIRNGFDHAWTARQKLPDNVLEEGRRFLKQLTEVVHGALEVKAQMNADEKGVQ